jgi:hypothetical protein
MKCSLERYIMKEANPSCYYYYPYLISSWHILSKKWSATINIQYHHVHHHELHDAALYAERTRQLHEFRWRRQKLNAVSILGARWRTKRPAPPVSATGKAKLWLLR